MEDPRPSAAQETRARALQDEGTEVSDLSLAAGLSRGGGGPCVGPVGTVSEGAEAFLGVGLVVEDNLMFLPVARSNLWVRVQHPRAGVPPQYRIVIADLS